jgi:hypothetical protein
MCAWERCEAVPTRSHVERLAELLGLEVDGLAAELSTARANYRSRVRSALAGKS